MNVLHLFPSAHRGGSELCALETIRVLKSMGVENHVIVPADGYFVSNVPEDIFRCVMIKNDWWMSNPKWPFWLKCRMIPGFVFSAWNIRKYIKNNQIDLVVTHTLVLPSGALAAKVSGVPHIWYIHEYGDLDHQLIFTYGKKTMLSFIDLFSKKIIVNSKALKEHFKGFLSKKKTEQIYYVVEYPYHEPINYKQENSLSICIVGRVADGKNQMVLFKALARLKKEGIVPSVIFVGGIDKPYKILMDDFYTKHQLTNQVQYIGHTHTPWEYVQKADCIVVSSRHEAFGRVTVEAMKTGKVSVVSNTGAGKELIDNEVSGFLFNPEDDVELAQILKKLWQAGSVGDMTTKAQAFAKTHFNKEAHLEAFKKLIDQCK